MTYCVCLFHNTNITKKQYKRTLTPYLLNAAKGIIPTKWLDSEKSTIKEWFGRIDHIFKIEYLSSREEGQAERFNSIWKKLIDLKKLESTQIM